MFCWKGVFFQVEMDGWAAGGCDWVFFPAFFKVRLCFLAIVFEHLEKICFVGKVFCFQVEMDR